MSAATKETETTRAEMVERYVLLNALDLALNNLMDDPSPNDVIRQTDSLFEELWTGDLDKIPEFILASARSDLLVSRMFSRLASNPTKCQSIAGHFARCAEDELVRLDALTKDAETFEPVHAGVEA